MDWYNVTGKYHEQTFAHECRLSALPEVWQRELAAIWRLEADVNNGAYLQFLANWGRESYEYASQALKKIGAHKMAGLVDRSQALVDEHFHSQGASAEGMRSLMPNPIIGRDGDLGKEAGSILPEPIVERINELSYEFMGYPEDLAQMGLAHYRANLVAAGLSQWVSMNLETAQGLQFEGVNEEQLREVFRDDASRGEYVILWANPRFLMQAMGEGDGPYLLEYQEEDLQHHYSAGDTFTKAEVERAFLWLLAEDPRWRQEFAWEKIAWKPWWKFW